MTMVRGQYAQLLAPGIRKLFVEWEQLAQREEQYSKIFNVGKMDKAFEDDVQFAAFGPMPEKTEGGAVIYADAIQGGTKRYIALAYALACRMSWELVDDDQYGVIKQVPKAQARSAKFTEEMTSWNVFNQGFTTTVSTDGVSLFNNQHPLLGGPAATNVGPGLANVISAAGTYPNRPAVDADLSFTALQLMVNHFERMTDSQGMPIVLKPKTILIPPELKFVAQEILGSPKKPYTNDNEINALLGEGLDYMICHYFTSASAWFAVTDKSQHQLNHLKRKALDMDYDDDFDTRATKAMSFMRFAVGATDWRGLWGSNGP